MEERVRIADIADELGLSSATVSNVIHGKTKKISDETVKRVQELLEKRQYIPSMAAILLSQNNSRIIGVVANDHAKYEGRVLEDGFISASLNALLPELEKAGYFMMVKVTNDREEVIRFASMWNMDGLVLLGFCETDYVRLREKMHIPLVAYDGFFEKNERICNLKIDDYDGGRQVGEYLYRMGHRRALLISDNDICMDRERMQGFRLGFRDGKADMWQVPMSREERRHLYGQKLEQIREYSAVLQYRTFMRWSWSISYRSTKYLYQGIFPWWGMTTVPCARIVIRGLRQWARIRLQERKRQWMPCAVCGREPAWNVHRHCRYG